MMFYARRIGREQDGDMQSKQEAIALVQVRGNESQNQVICDGVEKQRIDPKAFYRESKNVVSGQEDWKQGLPSDYSQVPRAQKLGRWY